MRVTVQRVKEASVEVDGKVRGEIQQGLLVFAGFESTDNDEDLVWIIKKLCNLRIFSDEEGKMNRSVKDVNGGFLVISQFTLHASYKKGNRPSYIKAAKPLEAESLYERFLMKLRKDSDLKVESGIFGADMKVRLLNDGPVTINMDTKNKE